MRLPAHRFGRVWKNLDSRPKSWKARSPARKATRSSCYMAAVKTVGIFAKPNAPAATRLVPELLAWLAERGITIRLDEVAAAYAAGYAGPYTALPRPEVPDGCDLAI